MTTKPRHVFAIPTGPDFMDPAIDVGEATTVEGAVLLVQQAGYIVIPNTNGGSYDSYDDEDAPGIYGYEPDGLGAFSVTVEITAKSHPDDQN